MLIVCKIKREGGTNVDFGKKKYHFKPKEADGMHIAEVIDPDHIATLLAIKEAYVALENVDDDADDDAPPPAEAPAQPVMEWSNKKAMAYAQEVLGINPEDKGEILAFAESKGIALDKRKGIATLIREVVSQIGVEDEDNAE